MNRTFKRSLPCLLVLSSMFGFTHPVIASSKALQVAQNIPSGPITSVFDIYLDSSPQSVTTIMSKIGPRVTLGHQSDTLIQYWGGAYDKYPADRWDFEFSNNKLFQVSVYFYVPTNQRDTAIQEIKQRYTKKYGLSIDMWSTIKQLEGIDSIFGITDYSIRIVDIPGGPLRLIFANQKIVNQLEEALQ